MPRKQKQRKIFLPPRIKGYQAIGLENPETIELNLDELEAIKLLDYENLNQQDVATNMNVSRPTLTRIYNRARKKIAKAIVEGKSITFGGGSIYFEKSWFYCSACNISYNLVDDNFYCPFCKEDKFSITLNSFYSKVPITR
jgi:predicted DNA-binding protein (UPF0251 family)